MVRLDLSGSELQNVFQAMRRHVQIYYRMVELVVLIGCGAVSG